MNAIPTGDPQFHTTRWSMVVAAAGEGGEEPRAALEELCEAYWYPVYAFLRRRGKAAEDAGDLTQEFFAALLEKGYLADADPERGRFRTFVLTAVSRLASKERDKAAALKRGGGKKLLSLDFEGGEARYQREPEHQETAERIFERRWALTLLERTLAALREQHAAAGKLPQFDSLKVFLTGDADAPRLRTVAGELGMTEGSVKVAVHRMRQKYRELLRTEIAQTIAGQGDVDSELAELFKALRAI